MYNYNTNEGGAGAFIRELVIKLIFVIILVLLLIWLFPMPNMQPFYDRIYSENITLMKDTAKNYYTKERLPVKVDDKVTMTLGEMVDKHLILNLIDKEGNTCDTSDSYVEVTKLATEYELKTTLSCGDEEEYIIEYIGCHDVCTAATCTPAQVVAPLTKPVTKTVTKTNTVVKYIDKPCPTCPTCPTCKTPPEDPPVVTETWNLYGHDCITTISDWSKTKKTVGSTTSNGITTTITLYDEKDVVTEEAEIEYERESATIYSCGWISQWASLPYTLNYNTAVGDRLIDLDELGLSEEAQRLDEDELDFEADSPRFFSTTTDFENYKRQGGKVLYMEDGDNGWVSSTSASNMKTASLGSGNMTIDNDVSWSNSHDTYQVNTTLRILNFDGKTPYLDSGLGNVGGSIYYLPYKFTVSWNEPTTTDEETETLYRYKTVVSYTDVWALKGSPQETALISNGYKFKQSKVVTK